jgi:Protein of unknown function (DUF3592)
MVLKPVMLILTAVCVLLAAALGISAIRFVADSAEAQATVSDISAHNDRCSKGRKKHRNRYDCTIFTASVRFDHAGSERTATVPAGKTREHNQPIAAANVRIGQTLPILYRQSAPYGDVYRADRGKTLAIWGKTLLALLFGAVFFFIAIMGSRR